MENKQQTTHSAGLDFLRMLSTVAVLVYHWNPQWLPGGYLAVCTFLVLHGYLFVRSNQKKASFSVVQYWTKRVLRLVLPMVLTVLVTLALLPYSSDLVWLNEKTESVQVLTFRYNWWQIAAGDSYFSRVTDSPFTHLWYLSLLIQMELVLPLLWTLYRKLERCSPRLAFVLSTLWVLLWSALLPLYIHWEWPSMRVYFGTDSRCFSIFLGMWFALQRKKEKRTNARPFVHTLLAVAGLGAMVFLCLRQHQEHSLYPYSFFAMSLLSGLLIRLLDQKAALLSSAADNRFVRFLSAISFNVYLVHYPILFFSRSQQPMGQALHTYAIPLILLAASLLHGAMGVFQTKPTAAPRRLLAGVLLLALLYPSYLGVQEFRTATDHTQDMQDLEAQLLESARLAEEKQAEILANRKEALDLAAQLLVEEETVDVTQLPVTGIGDSVMLGAVRSLYETFPNGDFDAQQNRSHLPLLQIVRTRAADGTLGNPVIIGIGTNSLLPIEDCREVVRLCGDRTILWLTTTNDWQFPNNATIRTLGEEFDNVTIVDWEQFAAGHEDFFAYDGIHLTATGRQNYCQLLVDTLDPLYNTPNHEKENKERLLVIADSYLLPVKDALRSAYPDSPVFIQKYPDYELLLETVQDLKERDLLPNRIVLCFSQYQETLVSILPSLLQSMEGHEILLLQVPTERDLELPALLNRTLQQYPAVTPISWDKEVLLHPSYFAADRTHLSDEGAQALLETLSKQFQQ